MKMIGWSYWYNPRFQVAWPTYKGAVMGAEQLAGVLSIIAKANAESLGSQSVSE